MISREKFERSVFKITVIKHRKEIGRNHATSFSILGCYPSSIPQNPKVSNKKEVNSGMGNNIIVSSYGSLKEMPKVIWTLLTNGTYMMINLGGAADGFTISGLSAFLPKYFQSQYGFSSGFAVMLVGIIGNVQL